MVFYLLKKSHFEVKVPGNEMQWALGEQEGQLAKRKEELHQTPTN